MYISVLKHEVYYDSSCFLLNLINFGFATTPNDFSNETVMNILLKEFICCRPLEFQTNQILKIWKYLNFETIIRELINGLNDCFKKLRNLQHIYLYILCHSKFFYLFNKIPSLWIGFKQHAQHHVTVNW